MVRKKKDDINAKNFEDIMQELQELVVQLEGGELSLEDSIQAFTKSMNLTKVALEKLHQAEQAVELLLADDKGEVQTKLFSENEG